MPKCFETFVVLFGRKEIQCAMDDIKLKNKQQDNEPTILHTNGKMLANHPIQFFSLICDRACVFSPNGPLFYNFFKIFVQISFTVSVFLLADS